MTRHGHNADYHTTPPCSTGKRAYRRRRSAILAAKQAHKDLHVYRCPICGWHHLTTPKRAATPPPRVAPSDLQAPPLSTWTSLAASEKLAC